MAKTLLAVEDSNTMRRVLEITLASADYRIELVDNAQSALDELDRIAPDTALVDISLPDTNGYELCRALKSRRPELPVLLLSSIQQPYDPARGAEVQADDYIDKPFDTQALCGKVDQLLARADDGVVSVQPEVASAGQDEAHGHSVPPPLPVASRPSSADGLELDGSGVSSVPPPMPATAPPPAAAAEAVAQASSEVASRAAGLGLTSQQLEAITALSREVVEKAVWEVVPALAETLIKEEIARLTRE